MLIDRRGEIAGVYRKNFPTHGELENGITPGVETPVFETDFGRVGLCICFDLNYWEVGSELCRNRAELVIWPSMWAGGRMLSKWAMEFGFILAAVWKEQATFVDVAGRELLSVKRDVSDRSGRSPVVTARLDLDRRLLHPDYNLDKLQALFERYGGDRRLRRAAETGLPPHIRVAAAGRIERPVDRGVRPGDDARLPRARAPRPRDGAGRGRRAGLRQRAAGAPDRELAGRGRQGKLHQCPSQLRPARSPAPTQYSNS